MQYKSAENQNPLSSLFTIPHQNPTSDSIFTKNDASNKNENPKPPSSLFIIPHQNPTAASQFTNSNTGRDDFKIQEDFQYHVRNQCKLGKVTSMILQLEVEDEKLKAALESLPSTSWKDLEH